MEIVVEVKRKSTKNIKKKENMPPPPPSPLQLQTTPDFAPNEMLKEMGFDISPTTTTTTTTSSNSTVSPTTLTTLMDEKKYNLNICLIHLSNLELFQAMSNKEWYVKYPFSGKCGVFAHRTMQNYCARVHVCAHTCARARKITEWKKTNVMLRTRF